jgi:alcohol dehydrogenase
VWAYHNPVEIVFGDGALGSLGTPLAGRSYCLVTYPDAHFEPVVAATIEAAGYPPVVEVRDIVPNPDYTSLDAACRRYREAPSPPAVIVALGGGSVLDSAKVLAAADGDFARVRRHLEGGAAQALAQPVPIVAIPTTAGTGSESTCWATVWDTAAQRKHSLAAPGLYPEVALVDPELTHGAPRALTIHTGLDALSHSLESLWNRNANPVSANHAIAAAREIIECLPRLARDLANRALRHRMARAALLAGLAFSNTRTALAHSLSYAVTLRHGVPHGLACSFTLPWVMRSVINRDEECDARLAAIFGPDLRAGADRLSAFLADVGVSEDPAAHGVAAAEFDELVTLAFAGERGQNFIGTREALMTEYRGGGAGRATA